jgi:hypothetical protein
MNRILQSLNNGAFKHSLLREKDGKNGVAEIANVIF